MTAENERTPSDPAAGTDDATAPAKPGDERQDTTRTPGDGTLQGATPAGLGVDELRKRAEEDGADAQPGTG